MLSLEQGIMYLLALAFGCALGAIFVVTIVPALTFTGAPAQSALSQLSDAEFYLLQHILPVHIVVPASLDLVLTALVALGAGALFLMVHTALRPAISQQMRLSTD